MSILFLIIIGAAAGLIATKVMKLETGLIPTIAIGIGGALIGGLVLRFLLTMLGFAAGLIGAILGAMALIWFWQNLQKK